ncbi:adenylyl-sulfate kinase [Lederbergia citrea]|uniref:Adenylyl-sulfate kinase n=1 Tax=Lederbergia citrea TaxID=2833581 RepID=A0A942Z447_9BACI|nr:adenylyl-sulfate kinase [Lederbergia citrea]MBS4176681.1 adenylyl-sulfate kinase [Lederbergia citrea]MBS4203242.1 adenylyl-sulfate kinase [Lederbergia citrea]MBS4222087.1 adenylyl-sulfate kinase [Lederbergia citrea]
MNNNGESDKNIVWHQSTLTKEERQKQHGHKSIMIWFTGLSGSGKSTIANAVQNELYKKNISVYLLDGDNLRHGINSNLSFTAEDRQENIRRAAEIGKLFVDAGVVVLAALISPFEKERMNARAIFKQDEFIEVYVKCSIEECETRDPKGLYKKARKGEIKDFTGIDQPYEEPQNPEIIIDTNKLSIDEAVEILSSYLFDTLELNTKE